MNFNKLADIFHNYALDIGRQKDPSARFRSMSYERVATKLLTEFKGTEKVSIQKINKMNITEYMKNKAIEFIKSPSSRKSENSLLNELASHIGIGNEKAKTLIDAGLKNMNQLKLKKYQQLLNNDTKLFLSMKPLREILHQDIKKLEPYILSSAKGIGKAVIVGSFRRKKQMSRDIDVMIVSDKKDALDKYLNKLKSELPNCIFPYAVGSDKLSMLVDMTKAKLLKQKNKVFKLDVFKTNSEDEIPMLLYSTGSKENNIEMRSIAKKAGYLLNQKGLFKNGKKINNLKSEADYYKILGMKYKDPVDR